MLVSQNAISPDDFKKIVGHISRNTEYTSNLLENLLAWSQQQIEGVENAPKTIDIKEIVEENLRAYELTAKNKHIEVQNSITKPTTAFANEDSISLVVRNLITNTIKFSLHDSHITISSEINQKGMLQIEVQDEGIGMNKKQQAKLFDIQGKSTPGTNNEKGTGLGLMLCKKCVEENGGEIWVKSKQGKGSSFFFTLPLSEN